MNANKKLYPTTHEEWVQYCKDAKQILIANSSKRRNEATNDALATDLDVGRTIDR